MERSVLWQNCQSPFKGVLLFLEVRFFEQTMLLAAGEGTINVPSYESCCLDSIVGVDQIGLGSLHLSGPLAEKHETFL